MIRRKVYVNFFDSDKLYKKLVRAYDEFTICGYDFWITRSLSSEGSRPKYRCTEKTTGAAAGPVEDQRRLHLWYPYDCRPSRSSRRTSY